MEKNWYERNKDKAKARRKYKQERADHWLKQLRETEEMFNQDEPNEIEVEIW